MPFLVGVCYFLLNYLVGFVLLIFLYFCKQEKSVLHHYIMQYINYISLLAWFYLLFMAKILPSVICCK